MAELTAKEQLEKMINGTHEDVEVEDEVDEIEPDDENEIDEIDEIDEDESEDNIEDTEQETDTEVEEETEQENDGSTEETSEAAEEGLEENTHEGEDESEEESGQNKDAEETNETDEIDYKDFYEKVALAKFIANGKEVEGFKDPEDLIRAQQMLHGYSDKMKVFKEYKKFLKPLEERGVVSDPDKFNLAMSLLDGDPEAIKKVLKEKQIDPLELDLEDINYSPRNMLPSDAQMIIEETQEQAANLGIEDRFNRVIGKDWDIQSLQEFVNNGAVRRDLLQHLKDGTYDIVQNEVRKMELLDATGSLEGMSSVDKYRAAVARLSQQSFNRAPEKPAVPTKPIVDKYAEAEKAAKLKKEEEAFKAKAAEKEAKIAEERKKAASMSKRRAVKKPKPEPRLEELKGDEFRAAFRNMLMS